MEPMATPTYTAKKLGLLLLHAAVYVSALLLLMIPIAQEPLSMTCIILRVSGIALNFIRPALFFALIQDKAYTAVEYLCLNSSVISLAVTYIPAKDITSLASHIPWAIIIIIITIITIVVFLLMERAFYYFITQLSSRTNLGYFGRFDRGLCLKLDSFGLWIAAVWAAACCGGSGNVSAQLTEASPPPPYYHTIVLNNVAALREDEKINSIV